MKKKNKAIVLFLLVLIMISFQKADAQQMGFCDSVANNKMAGASHVFNIDDVSRTITVIVYNGDQPFNTSKVSLKFYEIEIDSEYTYLRSQDFNVNPEAKGYAVKTTFSLPGRYKIEAYTSEGKLICGERIFITARKKATGSAGFAAVLNEIIKFYPNDFINITGAKTSNDDFWHSWLATENLPGYDFPFIKSQLFEKKYWITLITSTADSTEALNKYNEISKMISKVKFDCCVFKNDEEYNYNQPDIPNNKMTTWFPASVNPGKEPEYVNMPLQLKFSYPAKAGEEYTVILNIGFQSAADGLLYAIKHTKMGNQ